MNAADKCLGDVFYETTELHCLFVQYYAQSKLHPDILLRNACLEKALIHCRNLTDFLTRKHGEQGVQTDDLLAEDFGCSVQTVDLPNDTKKRINKRIAHLTFSRASLSREWDMHELIPPILKGARLFFVELLASGLSGTTEITPSILSDVVAKLKIYG